MYPKGIKPRSKCTFSLALGSTLFTYRKTPNKRPPSNKVWINTPPLHPRPYVGVFSHVFGYISSENSPDFHSVKSCWKEKMSSFCSQCLQTPTGVYWEFYGMDLVSTCTNHNTGHIYQNRLGWREKAVLRLKYGIQPIGKCFFGVLWQENGHRSAEIMDFFKMTTHLMFVCVCITKITVITKHVQCHVPTLPFIIS